MERRFLPGSRAHENWNEPHLADALALYRTLHIPLDFFGCQGVRADERKNDVGIVEELLQACRTIVPCPDLTFVPKLNDALTFEEYEMLEQLV